MQYQFSNTNLTPNLQNISQTMRQIGRLEAIIVRPARRAEAALIQNTSAIEGVGLLHDRRGVEATKVAKISNRQVTLIQAEHLETIAKLMRLPNLHAIILRRNLVVSGVNLLAIKPLFKEQTHYLKIGVVLLEITGACAPCSRMEELLGKGGYNAMRGHGGVTAKVISSGELHVGDSASFVIAEAIIQKQSMLGF